MLGLSLFSGIGGLDIAFESAGGTIKAFCENEPFCQRVLSKHWPDVPLFGDVRELRGEDVGAVDIIYGGFPCQPFSVAGDKKGRNDSRYLWPEFSRLVGELRPSWVFGENVPGILSVAADDICADLEQKGYSVGIWDFEAASVGAPHRRERVFFVANSNCKRCQEQWVPFSEQEALSSIECNSWWSLEPRVGRISDGLPNRVDRLKALGNAVVPQQAYPIFKAIIDYNRRYQSG